MLPPLLHQLGQLYTAQDTVLRDTCIICRQNVIDVLNLGELINPGPCAAHFFCLLLAPTIRQLFKNRSGISGFPISEIYATIQESAAVTCTYCLKTGATLSCSEKECFVKFHLPCGLKHGSGHQFNYQFLSYCFNHRPAQLFIVPSLPQLCPYCEEGITYYYTNQIIWTPCCKLTIHRKCAQQTALALNKLFNCPFCQDATTFQPYVQRFGIYIPTCNLTNSFSKPLYRDEDCKADVCVNEHGKSYCGSNSWEVLYCNSCRTNGVHVKCVGLMPSSTWFCFECETDKEINTKEISESIRKNAILKSKKTKTISKPKYKPETAAQRRYAQSRPYLVRSEVLRYLKPDGTPKPATILQPIAVPPPVKGKEIALGGKLKIKKSGPKTTKKGMNIVKRNIFSNAIEIIPKPSIVAGVVNRETPKPEKKPLGRPRLKDVQASVSSTDESIPEIVVPLVKRKRTSRNTKGNKQKKESDTSSVTEIVAGENLDNFIFSYECTLNLPNDIIA